MLTFFRNYANFLKWNLFAKNHLKNAEKCRFSSKKETKRTIFSYLYHFYIVIRLHFALEWKMPKMTNLTKVFKSRSFLIYNIKHPPCLEFKYK